MTLAVAAAATVCVLNNLVIGQIPFLLGAAGGVNAVAAVRSERRSLAAGPGCGVLSDRLVPRAPGCGVVSELRSRRVWPFAGASGWLMTIAHETGCSFQQADRAFGLPRTTS